MSAVHVIVTCTKRKTRSAAEPLRLGSVQAESMAERAAEWIRRIRRAEGEPIPASELYSGDHWAIARALPDAAAQAGRDARLWVASAGYGLIPAESAVFPYSATFSTKHPDAVHADPRLSRAEAHRQWWRALSDWEGPVSGWPRTVRELAARDPHTPIAVVASPSYLDPMADDIVAAAAELHDRDTLVLFSGGADSMPRLGRHRVKYDARLQHRLGGAMMSLNVRVAREVLAERGALRLPDIAARLEKLARDLPAFRYPERPRLTDGEVKQFIRCELAAEPAAGWTTLHRKLRNQMNKACEQKRFRGLVHEVRAEIAIVG